MFHLSQAAASLLVLVCVIGGTVGLLIGSVMILTGGNWHIALGSAGVIASGVLMGKWFLVGNGEDQGRPPEAH